MYLRTHIILEVKKFSLCLFFNLKSLFITMQNSHSNLTPQKTSNTLFLIAFLLFVYHNNFAQTEFRFTHSNPYYSEGVSGVAGSNGGLYSAANIDVFIRTDTIILDCEDCKIPYDTIFQDIITSDILIIKTDNEGNNLWTKQIGNEGHDRCFGIFETTDNGILLCAIDSSYAGKIIKLNEAGNIIWENKIALHSPLQVLTVNENYLVFGTKSHLLNNTDTDIYAQLLNKQGQQIWIKYYGQNGSDSNLTGRFQETFKTSCKGAYDNIFIVGSRQNDIVWYDIDFEGTLLASGTIGDAGADIPVSVTLSDNLNYILLLNYATLPIYNTQPHLMKITSSGEILNETAYFDNLLYDKAVSVNQCSDGGFLISGLQNSNVPSLSILYNLKVNQNGIPQWIDNIPFTSGDYSRPAGTLTITEDEIFETGTNNSGRFTFAKRKLNTSNKNVEFNPVTRTGISSGDKIFVRLYPNPAKDYVIIETQTWGNAILMIYDLQGRKILTKQVKSDKIVIRLDNLNNGIYTYKLVNDDKIYKGKLLVNKK